MMKRIIFLVLILLVSINISACQSELQVGYEVPTATSAPPTPDSTATAEPTESQEITETAAENTPVPALTDTPAGPTSTPTPDMRELPEFWQRWPVIPEPSPWLFAFYEKSLATGNNPHHFSKVGDCQNIPEAFLGLYDSGDYTFVGNLAHLQDTIDYFAGSWERDSIAVDGGFTFPSIFSPLRADPKLCEPDETPLACEIRLHKPVFIIISLEFWYKGRTAESHEQFLRDAVEFTLSQGVIPVLATKADNVEGDHHLNLATAKIAYEYDVPLWNWWKAAQTLPNKGMDRERNDGFHISHKAWGHRSFTALSTIDHLHRLLTHDPAE